MLYRFENFTYLFLILALGTLSYSWRTIGAIGTWTAVMWGVAAWLVWMFGRRTPELTDATQAAFGHDPFLVDFLDPNSIDFGIRMQQIVVFLLVAGVLALSVRHSATVPLRSSRSIAHPLDRPSDSPPSSHRR